MSPNYHKYSCLKGRTAAILQDASIKDIALMINPTSSVLLRRVGVVLVCSETIPASSSKVVQEDIAKLLDSFNKLTYFTSSLALSLSKKGPSLRKRMIEGMLPLLMVPLSSRTTHKKYRPLRARRT